MFSKLRFGLLLVLLSLVGSVSMSAPKISAGQILDLVNRDRASYGLPKLVMDNELSEAAFAKAQDMINNKYFAHVSPSGTKPWNFFKSIGYNYVYAGENLALNYTDASDLEHSWMQSPKHRDNILSPNYSDLGLAIVKSGNEVVIVQFFGSKDAKLSFSK